MNLDKMLDELLEVEGGFTDDPSDSGGQTNHGITIAVARAFGYHGEMRDMPVSIARDIYRQRYWIQPGFDRVALHSEAIAEELLDTGVNMGQGIAAQFLQRSLNVLNLQGKTYPDMTVDGAIGAITLAALQAFLAKRGPEGEMVLLRMLNGLQAARYIEIAENSPKNERFSYGWTLHRVGGLS